MEKSPINKAIEVLEKFKGVLDFSKEAQTGVASCISLIEPLIQYERNKYIEICLGLMEVLAEISDRGEYGKDDEKIIMDYVDSILPNKPSDKTPSGGSFQDLLSKVGVRSKN